MWRNRTGGREWARRCWQRARGTWRCAACERFCWKQQPTMKRALRSGSGMAIVSKQRRSGTICGKSTRTKCGKSCRARQRVRSVREKQFERLLVVGAAGDRGGIDGILAGELAGAFEAIGSAVAYRSRQLRLEDVLKRDSTRGHP